MTTWGPIENSCRIGVDFHELPTITKDTDSITVGADLRWSSTAAVTDNTNTTYWDWVGYGTDPDGSDSDALKLTAFSGMKYFKSFTRPVSLVYGSAQNITLNAWVQDIEYVSDGQLDVSATLTVPARPFQTPRPPSGTPTVAHYLDPLRLAVSWVPDYTDSAGGYPWSGVYVWRWDNVSNVWTKIATVGPSATSYTDSTVAGDREYKYGIQPFNASGSPARADTESKFTIVAPHTNVTWAKATSDVVVSWAQASTLPVATQVWVSRGGAAYALAATVTAGLTSYTDPAPNPAVTHKYALLPVLTGAISTVYSYSTMVQLQAPPLAPTAVVPSGVAVDPEAGTVTATWAHNPVDGTAQTAYEHQVKVAGGAYVSSGKVTSASSSRTLSGLTRGGTYVHQVRTWGQHADPSPWSAEESFPTGAAPEVGITYPTAADHGKSTLDAAWTYYDLEANTHTASRVELWTGGVRVHTATLAGVTTHTLAFELANLTEYLFRTQVRDSTGLWSVWAEVTFSTDFVAPTTPTLTASFSEDTGSALLEISNPDADGVTAVEPVSNSVWRSIDGGDWVLVAEGLPVNTTVTDPVPASHGVNVYKAVAWSATPTSAESTPVDVVTASPWLYVNGGTGNGTVARLKGGPAVQLTTGRRKVLHDFVGHEHPVEFTGTARSCVYALSGYVDAYGAEADRWGTWQAWEAVAALPAPLVYRDPLGRYAFVSIAEVSIEHDASARKAKVSTKLTEVHHG